MLAAQDAGQDLANTTTDTLHVTTREVVLDVVVTDHNGKPIDNLQQKDFKVFENNVEQKIRSFTPPSAHVPPADMPPIQVSQGPDQGAEHADHDHHPG